MAYPNNQNYSLAPGFENAALLQIIAGYKPSGVSKPFQLFAGFGQYNAGAVRQLPLVNYLSGYPSAQWVFNYLDYDQYLWLKTTYCNGGYSGLVTALVTADDQLTIAYWNAKIVLLKESELRAYRPGWDHPTLTLFKFSNATPP